MASKDRIVLVTGGSSGIGRACCERFASEGARVLAADLHSPGKGFESSLITWIGLDVSRHDQWQSLTADVRTRHGRLHSLVNCAGILFEGTVEDTSLAQWRKLMAVNLNGTFFGCQAMLPLLRESGAGSIVNLSSVSGMKGDPLLTAYDTSKGAVRTLSKEIAVYCARQSYPVRCNSVHPGVVETPMVSDFFKSAKHSTEQQWNASQPIGRLIAPEEVAGLVAWLCSPEASFATGAEYTIDGGMTA
ncbi:SDR family oxidoreductase [Aestuariivirga sp.]|uniref:SDR family oxidoreductase n=1 Tax=Aestuariivirga sp. TaxID=2650926 RepID=UPI0039E71EF8